MSGRRINIAKLAAQMLISTLQENDVFNVILIKDTQTFLIECRTDLVQANKENKESMRSEIAHLSAPKGTMNLAAGFRRTFDVFKTDNTSSTHDRIKCIVLISDDLEGNEHEVTGVIDEINPERDVRIFTYRVGRHKSEYNNVMKDIACTNRGYYYNLPTVGKY